MIENKDDYTYYVEHIKENVKNQDIRRALLRAVATQDDTILFWYDWDGMGYYDDWEDALQISNMPTRFRVLYLEGYYLRIAYYGSDEVSTMGLGSYDFKATLIDVVTGSKICRINLSELESELKKLFLEAQESYLAEITDEEEITY